MARVVSGSCVVEAHGLDFDQLIDLSKNIVSHGYGTMMIVVKPGTVIGSIHGFEETLSYSVAPGSFILSNCNEYLVSYLNQLGVNTYVLVRDCWLDTVSISLDTLLSILNNVSRILDNGGCIDIYDKYVLCIEWFNGECIDLIVMDHVNIPLYWLGSRKTFYDEKYVEALNESYSLKTSERALSYIKVNGDHHGSTMYRKCGDKICIDIRAPKNCSGFRRYLFWLILDLIIL